MTRFWLIRHGEPTEQSKGRCYGSLEVGLSATGRAQMAAVAECLRREPVSTIYTSPRSRALESAQILAGVAACPVEVVADLREMNFGDFEGLTYGDIEKRYPDLYRRWMETPTEVQFPNGESFSEMRDRVLGAFESIRRDTKAGTVMIVSHGGVNRMVIAHALEMPDRCLFRLEQDHAAMNLLCFVENTPLIKLLNQHPQLNFARREA